MKTTPKPKKLTRNQQIDKVFSTADHLRQEMDKAGLCVHYQADVLAVALSDQLRWLNVHHGIEAVDDILSTFVSTLGTCTKPMDEDDRMPQLKITLKIERE